MPVEYRIGVTTRWATACDDGEWVAYEDPSLDEDQVRRALEAGTTPRCLEEALDLAGFDYWVETRTVTSAATGGDDV